MSMWILIEAEHPERFEHVVCGPFETEAEANHHLQDSLQVQGWCEDDAVDAWYVNTDAEKDEAIRAWTEHGDNWGLYMPIPDEDEPVLRVDPDDEAGRELHNKCEDCCLVIGCDVCGPCAEHDETP